MIAHVGWIPLEEMLPALVVGSGTATVTPSGGVCVIRLAKPTVSSTAFPFRAAW